MTSDLPLMPLTEAHRTVRRAVTAARCGNDRSRWLDVIGCCQPGDDDVVDVRVRKAVRAATPKPLAAPRETLLVNAGHVSVTTKTLRFGAAGDEAHYMAVLARVSGR
jgi:hypothetical protein